MKTSKFLKILFAFTLLTLFLPWFTYDAKLMGYRCGFVFFKWFLIPAVTLAYCLFGPERSLPIIILGELAHLGNVTALACSFGLWQQVCNIKSGFQWAEGLRTAQPGYWIAVCFHVLFFMCCQIEWVKGTARRADKELQAET